MRRLRNSTATVVQVGTFNLITPGPSAGRVGVSGVDLGEVPACQLFLQKVPTCHQRPLETYFLKGKLRQLSTFISMLFTRDSRFASYSWRWVVGSLTAEAMAWFAVYHTVSALESPKCHKH